LLYRITLFVRNKFFNGQTEKDISHIAGFGYAICNFISSIYKLEWDTLTANNNNNSFHQYTSAQKLKNTRKDLNKKKEISKTAEISRVSPLFPLGQARMFW